MDPDNSRAEEAYERLMRKLEAYRNQKASKKATQKKPPLDSVDEDDGSQSKYQKRVALRKEKQAKIAEYRAEKKRQKEASKLARVKKVLEYRQEKKKRDRINAGIKLAEQQERERKRKDQRYIEKVEEDKRKEKESRYCACGALKVEGKDCCRHCERERRERLFEYFQPSEIQIKSAKCRVVRKGHEQS